MSKNVRKRVASLTALLLAAIVTCAGCEPKGPAERAGESIDRGVQSAKDTVNPPGPSEKAGRSLDKALRP